MHLFRSSTESRALADREDLLAKGVSDTTTKVDVSIKIYFSEPFAAVTSDINGKVAEIIAGTNAAYANSKVLINLVLTCIEKYTGPEVMDSSAQLNHFE